MLMPEFNVLADVTKCVSEPAYATVMPQTAFVLPRQMGGSRTVHYLSGQ